jgi:hypothetical protein
MSVVSTTFAILCFFFTEDKHESLLKKLYEDGGSKDSLER